MSGASSAADETATTPDPAPGAAAADPLRAPALARRLAAFLYEGVLCFGILFATGLVYAVTVHQTHGLQHRSGLVGSCFVVLGLYFVGLWVRGGQTLAMKTWHLRVVAADGRPLAPRRALLRYLLAWVWVLPPLMAAKALALPSAGADFGLVAAWIVLYAASARLHPRRQFWHDAICGTAIVTARPATALPA
ncbi:MAG: RDD family protein [Burkholderiaceae bacterium]